MPLANWPSSSARRFARIKSLLYSCFEKFFNFALPQLSGHLQFACVLSETRAYPAFWLLFDLHSADIHIVWGFCTPSFYNPLPQQWRGYFSLFGLTLLLLQEPERSKALLWHALTHTFFNQQDRLPGKCAPLLPKRILHSTHQRQHQSKLWLLWRVVIWQHLVTSFSFLPRIVCALQHLVTRLLVLLWLQQWRCLGMGWEARHAVNAIEQRCSFIIGICVYWA